MQTLFYNKKSIKSILGTQKFKKNIEYRMMYYVICEPTEEDGLVVYNNITKSAYILNQEEKNAFYDLDFNNPSIKKLLKQWYFVPNDFNELQTYKQLLDIYKVFNEAKKSNDGYCAYTILPSTDCNARCFYCYEKGCKKITMDRKITTDTASFIMKNSPKNKKIKLAWFGGEPLINIDTINSICNILNKNNYDFKSTMISNGYLFDKKIINLAKKEWHLKNVQITLDGTRDIYNKTKSYYRVDIKKTQTPFDKVIDNIDTLVQNKIYVIIRLNVSKKNYNDLLKLIDFLDVRFGKYKKDFKSKKPVYLHIYAKGLFQEEEENEAESIQRESNINNYIESKGFYGLGTISREIKINHCMADYDGSVIILPDGTLTSCEHFTEGLKAWGSIYEQKKNTSILKEWKSQLPIQKECYKCANFPNCIRLKNCPNVSPICSDINIKHQNEMLHKKLQNTYKIWKLKKDNKSQTNKKKG